MLDAISEAIDGADQSLEDVVPGLVLSCLPNDELHEDYEMEMEAARGLLQLGGNMLEE